MRSPIGPKVSEESIEKPPSRLGLSIGLAVVALVAAFAITAGGADSADPDDTEAEVERAIEPVPTIMTLATGPDTAARVDPPVVPVSAAEEKMPDRGAFRAALATTLVSSCDGLIDGPEPISAGLYREHGRCVSAALVGLDERCKLAAAVFYVLPSDEALDMACDIQTGSQRFRESVRRSMEISCDVQRSIVDPHHEAFYEYDRCLQAIAGGLDQTCYLAARAQFLAPEEAQLREACEIPESVDLGPSTD